MTTNFETYSYQELKLQIEASKKAYEAGKLTKGQVKVWHALTKEFNKRKQAPIDFNINQANLF
jgi:hypothetical protein